MGCSEKRKVSQNENGSLKGEYEMREGLVRGVVLRWEYERGED